VLWSAVERVGSGRVHEVLFPVIARVLCSCSMYLQCLMKELEEDRGGEGSERA
jgi:hypothetical protein